MKKFDLTFENCAQELDMKDFEMTGDVSKKIYNIINKMQEKINTSERSVKHFINCTTNNRDKYEKCRFKVVCQCFNSCKIEELKIRL